MSGSGRNQREDGFSLIELTIVLVLFAGLIGLVGRLSLTVTGAQKNTKSVMRTMRTTRRLATSIRPHLSAAAFFAENNASGAAYLALMDTTRGPARFASRLPEIDATGTLRQDASGETRTGNTLLMAEHVGYDAFVTKKSQLVSIPLYRFHLLYLSTQGSGPQPDHPDGLDFNHWVSEVVADGAKIDEITDATDKEDLLAHLRDDLLDADGHEKPPIEVAWLVGADPSTTGTLRMITSSSTLSDTPSGVRGTTWRILEDPRRTRYRMLTGHGLSIATNYAPNRMGIAAFGRIDFAGGGFPHGLEFQLVGRSSARQALCRFIVVEAGEGKNACFDRHQFISYTPQGGSS